MEIEIIGAILGSAVISTLVSSLFSHFINRKNNTLQHITEERKIWREKIRKISEDLENVKFKDKKINQLLVQLEVNINSYGKVLEDDYEKDSHIWREIEELKRIDKKKEFNVHKELLIYYLSLMLKEDWERSKQEVKGYSRTLKEIFIIIFTNCILGIWYLWDFDYGLDDKFDILMNIIVVSSAIYIIFRYYCDLDIWKMIKNNRFSKTYVIRIIISYIELIVFVVVAWGLLWYFLSKNCSQFYLRNLFSCGICVGEAIFVYLNWVNSLGKKAQLARTVINARQEFLIENRLNEYDKDIKKIYKYITKHSQDPEKLKSAVIVLKNLISEYEMELYDRKRMLKKEKKSKKRVKQINRIQGKIKEVKELADEVNQSYKEGIINKIISWFKTMHALKLISKMFIKMKMFFWNEPGKMPFI